MSIEIDASDYLKALSRTTPRQTHPGEAVEEPRASALVNKHRYPVLDKISKREVYDPDAIIVSQGEPAVSFFLIDSGHARSVQVPTNGKRLITGFNGPGDLMGYGVISTYRASIEAITPMVIRRIDRRSLTTLLASGGDSIQDELMQSSFGDLQLQVDRLMIQGRLSARAKLGYFLIELGKQQKTITQDRPAIALVMSHVDIANYLMITKETLSREFAAWKKAGIIRMDRPTEVVVLDLAELTALASDEGEKARPLPVSA